MHLAKFVNLFIHYYSLPAREFMNTVTIPILQTAWVRCASIPLRYANEMRVDIGLLRITDEIVGNPRTEQKMWVLRTAQEKLGADAQATLISVLFCSLKVFSSFLVGTFWACATV